MTTETMTTATMTERLDPEVVTAETVRTDAIAAAPAPAGGLAFVPLRQAGLSHWNRLVSFGWLDTVGVLPIADTEFMALAHFCPLAVEMHAGGPRLVVVMHSGMVVHRLVGPDGRWRPPYAPLALRSLPFRNGAALAQNAIEICPDLAGQGTDPALRQVIFGEKGKPSPSYATILGMLDRLARSAPRLRNAVKVLMAADLLAPLATPADATFGALHSISQDALLALSEHRLMALTSDACCPLELAAAICFSRRWLTRDSLAAEAPLAANLAGIRPVPFDHGPASPLDLSVGLDDSALFSFDDFVRSTAASP
ncbi:SapC family protein [Phreatobacter sp. AB_2022a]|uniref:SapC family protein n=1 Tax=Phreatobacter sp. AB_2022a TaxID=3003134 RepID=UPI0022871D8A|nr:SapC family protein [Phreatobacter sp. AB_2022a]MCZ0733218.1 SapC family protein [Phreatobacter sp. AB_2022a]